MGDELLEKKGNYPNPTRQRGIHGELQRKLDPLADVSGCENDPIHNPPRTNCVVLSGRERRNKKRRMKTIRRLRGDPDVACFEAFRQSIHAVKIVCSLF